MSDTVFKRLNVSDTFSIPYTANKLWNVTASDFIDYGLYFREATYSGDTLKQNLTYSDLLYKSLLANYYPEFYPTFSHSTSSYSQTLYWNTNLNTSSYDGFQRPGNGATTVKHFYTSSVGVINIPNTLYSNKILPLTFEMDVEGGKIYDDGEYNLRWSGSNYSSSVGTLLTQSSYVGNIFYEQGLGVLTEYSGSINKIQFKNSYTLYEQNMICRVKDYEFNASYNPTLTTGTVGYIFQTGSNWVTGSNLPNLYTGSYYTYPDNQVKDFATASYFSPYVSSIGFYNDANQLLAVAQMSQPVPLSNATDITFIVKLDW